MNFTVEDLPVVFSDVSPKPQPDHAGTVCRINYKADFILAYNYFRAICETSECSERTLRLTELCVTLNPANYTVWQVRRKILHGLEKNARLPPVEPQEAIRLNQETNKTTTSKTTTFTTATRTHRISYELQLAATLGGDNPKNYQLWYHRKAILETAYTNCTKSDLTRCVTAENNEIVDKGEHVNVDDDDDESILIIQALLRLELEYLTAVIRVDGKNYHAWSHRQWILNTLSSSFLLLSPSSAAASSESSLSLLSSTIEPENQAVMEMQNELWQSEISYSTHLITDDGRNNSAWNHRWFVLHRLNDQSNHNRHPTPQQKEQEHLELGEGIVTNMNEVIDDMVYHDETQFALSVATLDPYNESPWRYFIALVKEQVRGHLPPRDQQQQRRRCSSPPNDAYNMIDDKEIGSTPIVRLIASYEAQVRAVQSDETYREEDMSSHLLTVLIDLLELSPPSSTPNRSDRIAEFCDRLVILDPIRQNYWRWRATPYRATTSTGN